MHGTAFADEAGAKVFENAVGVDEDATEALDGFRVVGGVVLVLIEGSGVVELDRGGMDADFDFERTQARHVFGVKIRNRARIKRNDAFPALAGAEGELVGEEVEFCVESLVAIGNG